MLRFDSLAKDLVFDNKKKCSIESSRKLPVSEFNTNKPSISIITLNTKADIVKYLYPRVDDFHKKFKPSKRVVPRSNIFQDTQSVFSNTLLPIYDSPSKDTTLNTIDYVFNELRRGVFVQIQGNKIKTFVAINNYEGSGFDISKRLKVDPAKYKDLDDFVHQAQITHFKNYRLTKRQEDSIYFLDCAVNLWERDPKPAEIDVDWLYTYQYHMLSELLKNRTIGDREFFINSKDQTMLVKDGVSSPHYHIVGNLTTPMNRKSKKYTYILNFGSHKRYADLAVPTNDDWELITQNIFLGLCRDTYIDVFKNINTDFDSKIPTCIFRGGSTGCGMVIKDNPRLKAAYLSNKYYNHPKYGHKNKNGQYLDARLISFKIKPKKHYSSQYIDIIDPKKLPVRLSKKMSFGQISNYKYVLSIEGNIAQFRLTLELSYNSVILLVKSEYYIWYQPLLEPWVHYVPVKSDLSDLMEKIQWCRDNDRKCKEIASRARLFYKKYITKESVFDYLEHMLNT